MCSLSVSGSVRSRTNFIKGFTYLIEKTGSTKQNVNSFMWTLAKVPTRRPVLKFCGGKGTFRQCFSLNSVVYSQVLSVHSVLIKFNDQAANKHQKWARSTDWMPFWWQKIILSFLRRGLGWTYLSQKVTIHSTCVLNWRVIFNIDHQGFYNEVLISDNTSPFLLVTGWYTA